MDPSLLLDKTQLRRGKVLRDHFSELPRRPIRLILDNVSGGYNIGALFRLCDAMLLERLIICGPAASHLIRKRSIAQAAQGTQHWVPWEQIDSTIDAVVNARQAGYQIGVIELTSTSIAPMDFRPRFPLCLVLGNERIGVAQSIVGQADVAIAIPMHGMANSLNLATAAAIVLYEVCKHLTRDR